MFNLGPFELVAIFVVALLVFGPDKLPEIGRQVGRAIREFRRIQSSFQTDLGEALDTHLTTGPIVPGPSPGAPPAAPAAGAPEGNGTDRTAGEPNPPAGSQPSEGTPPDAAPG